MFRICMLAVIFTVSNGAIASGDEGLYDELAPPGSTFIRILNGDEKSSPVNALLNANKIEGVNGCTASPYVFLPSGNIGLSISTAKEQFTFAENNFYTVVYKNGVIKVQEDTYFKNRRKALIAVYNLLSDTVVDLTAKSGAVKIIDGVTAGAKLEREINAVKIGMEIFSEGRQIVEPTVQSLTRGDVFSVFVCGSKNEVSANWQKWDVQAASTEG